jgi:hypothetical protein
MIGKLNIERGNVCGPYPSIVLEGFQISFEMICIKVRI